MYYVYIIRCIDNSLYTGITTDVLRRFEEHKSGNGAKYTKVHKPVKIEICWETDNKVNASKLEFWIKKLTKQDKEKLIKNQICLENVCDRIDKNKYQKSDFF